CPHRAREASMYALLLLVHLIVCIALVGVVLIQSGKGGGLAGGAFGGSAQTVFGGRGATDFFTKATMVLGAAFFLTSLTLALMSTGNTGRGSSLIQNEARHANTAGQPSPTGGQPSPTGGQPSPTQAPGAQQAPAT